MSESSALINNRSEARTRDGLLSAIRTDSGSRLPAVPVAPCTVVIEPRSFFRDCVLASLETVAPTTRFLAYHSVAEWAASDAVTTTDLVILWRAAEEGDPGGADDVEKQVAQVRNASADAPLALMSQQEDLEYVQRVMSAGANAFIPTSLGLRATIRVFDLVRAGGTFIPASCLAAAARPQAPGSAELAGLFSPKQLAVARALRKGMPNKLIAYELNMCESTVKVHVRTIMKKLKARNRTEVAFLTQSLGAAN